MNSDGIAYLDLADAYLRGGWTTLINGHWSPLYPWLLAIAMRVVRPSSYWEFTVAHLLNLAIYVVALISFEYMMRQLVTQSQRDRLGNTWTSLPRWSLLVIGYLLFGWSSLSLITMEQMSPDVLMSIFVLLATALILRIRQGLGDWLCFFSLGMVLGLGYLAKAPMFPLAFVFLGVALFAQGNLKKANLRKAVLLACLAFFVFLSVSGPFITALSLKKGRFTFGESAKLNYLWVINKAGPHWYSQDAGTAGGKFLHPPKKIFDFPPVYEFSDFVGGTQPVWYDPSYWIEGATPRLDLKKQLLVLIKNSGIYFELLFSSEAALLTVAIVLMCFAGPRPSLRGIAAQWPILIPSLAALLMYAVVLVETRYVAVFLAILWIALFSGIRLPVARDSSKLAAGVTLAIAVVLGAPLAQSSLYDINQGLRHHGHPQWEVAENLRYLGIHPGDRVARIGGQYAANWARLLRVRVVAEVPRDKAGDFWSATPAVQAQILDRLRRIGVTAVVAQQFPPNEVFAPGPEWKRMGNTDFYAFTWSRD
ncbi:MAG: hypothetical protein JO249_06365 [Acidobacteria bacterium]|nr:hypothetical protein [Acidobacteriota bacterium]